MRGNSVRSTIINTIREKKLVEKGDCVIVGLSGGPDSLCLFHVLHSAKEELGIRLYAVHVNHKFRPGAAEEDQHFVEEYCKKLGVYCKIVEADCNAIAKSRGLTSEEAGRMVRYQAFDDLGIEILLGSDDYRTGAPGVLCASAPEFLCASAPEFDARLSDTGLQGTGAPHTAYCDTAAATSPEKIKIAVAQNANDQAETVMFRLLRGTGTDGLAGIEYTRKSDKGFTIIRPLLDTWRREIEKYCQDENLNPRIDKTNQEPIYARNRLRLEILPFLEENANPRIQEALVRLASTAAEDKNYLWSLAFDGFDRAQEAANSAAEDTDTIRLSAAVLDSLAPSIRHRVLLLAAERIGLTQDIERVHLMAADQLIKKSKTGTQIDFPGGYKLAISYGDLVISKRENRKENGELPETEGICRILRIDDKDENITVHVGSASTGEKIYVQLSKAKLSHKNLETETSGSDFDITIRTRQAGDYIYVSAGIRKKIKDFFIDSKIPKEVRDKTPLLCIGSEVIAVLGKEMTGYSKGLEKTRYTWNYRV